MDIFFYLITFFLYISVLLNFFLFKETKKHPKKPISIESYNTLKKIFEEAMDRAYSIMYKRSILVYSIDGEKVSEKDYNSISREFYRLSMKFLGPENKKRLTDFYGNEATLIFNNLNYFNEKYENDEIREEALTNFMGKDQLEE